MIPSNESATVSAPAQASPMSPALGHFILGLSGLGYPLTQAAIARFGRPGAIVADGVAIGLLVRDTVLVRRGAPRRLRALPARLLGLELAVAAVAAVTGLAAVANPRQPIERTRAGAVEALRRGAVSVLFGLHTYRFQIYLRPDHGLRTGPRTARDAAGSSK